MTDDLSPLEALAERATPGPWTLLGYDFGNEDTAPSFAIGREGFCVASVPVEADDGEFRRIPTADDAPPDADFIAAANPAVVLDLIKRVQAAEARVADFEARTARLRADYNDAVRAYHASADSHRPGC